MIKKHLYLNAAIAGLALISLGYFVQQSTANIGSMTVDDAFMITRYAKHWLAGEGFSWNPTDGPAYGITSPAYLFVITTVMGLTACSDVSALTYTSFIAGVLSLFALTWMGFLIQERKLAQKSWLPLLILPYIIFLTPLVSHSLTGMETTFSLLSNSLFVCAIVVAIRQRSMLGLLFCLFAGLLSVATRPDNGLYAVFLPPLFFFAHDWAMWRYSVRYILLFAFAVGISLILSKLLFNDFLPLPFFAKSGNFFKGYIGATGTNAIEQMIGIVITWLPCIMLIIITASKKTSPKLAAITILIFATFGYYATVTQIMGYQARYYYPSTAFVLFAVFVASLSDTATPTTQSSQSAFRRRFLFAIATLLTLLLLFFFRLEVGVLWEKYITGPPFDFHGTTQYQKAEGNQLPSLGWGNSVIAMGGLLQRVPRGTVIAASEYGWIGSKFPQLTIIDLVGLQDRTIAHHGFSAVYVMSRKPDLIWLPHPDYTYEVAQLLDDPTFIQDYEYYPGAWDYGIALNKRSLNFTTLKYDAEQEFSQIYPGLNMPDYMAEPTNP